MCNSRVEQELAVDIYGTKEDYSNELISSDVRQRIEFINDSCPITDWDYITQASIHNKNGCDAYVFDYTTIHTLDFIANKTYENGYTCTRYNMSPAVTEKLRAMQE